MDTTATRRGKTPSPDTDPKIEEFRERVRDAFYDGAPVETIKAVFNLSHGELEDIVGEPIEEPDETGRNPMTGY